MQGSQIISVAEGIDLHMGTAGTPNATNLENRLGITPLKNGYAGIEYAGINDNAI